MIDIKSLRLGNIVQFYDWYKDGMYKQFRIISIDQDSEYLSLSDGTIRTCISFNELEPVPLTKELLLKYGFKKDASGSFHVKNIEIYFSNNESFGVIDNIPIKGLKYLHQLQNIYYYLENKELEV